MELNDTTCVVTGAARGLGADLARELVTRGAKVMLADINQADLRAVSDELAMPGFVCDVTSHAQVARLSQAAIKRFGRIDLWLNNAGLWMPYAPIEKIDEARAHALMEVNYFGLMYGTIEAVRHMRPRGSGTILNIISVRGLEGKAQAGPYSASKFAAEGFTQAARAELAGRGVRVIGVYPFRIKTELFGNHKHDGYEDSMEPAAVARIIIDHLATDSRHDKLEIWDLTDVRKKQT